MKYCNQKITDCGIYQVERPKEISYFLPGSVYRFTGEISMKPIKQALSHMAGWLVQKVKLCDRCEDTLFLGSTDNPSAFMPLVCEMETTFMKFINEYLERKGLAMILINKVKESCHFQFLYDLHEEHAHNLEKKNVQLFVITRIFYFIKFLNRDLNPRNKSNSKKLARIVHN